MPCPRLFAQRGGALYVRRQASSRCREKLDATSVAFDDLRDPRAVQADLVADLPQRKTFLLGPCERFASGVLGGFGIAFEGMLRGAYAFECHLAL